VTTGDGIRVAAPDSYAACPMTVATRTIFAVLRSTPTRALPATCVARVSY
jgi:hypothetical protein